MSMREEFEDWVKSMWPAQSLALFNDGEYQGFTVQHCWAAWQASRAAIEVEFPDSTGRYYNGCPASAIEDPMQCWRDGYKAAADRIKDAGIKVKP